MVNQAGHESTTHYFKHFCWSQFSNSILSKNCHSWLHLRHLRSNCPCRLLLTNPCGGIANTLGGPLGLGLGRPNQFPPLIMDIFGPWCLRWPTPGGGSKMPHPTPLPHPRGGFLKISLVHALQTKQGVMMWLTRQWPEAVNKKILFLKNTHMYIISAAYFLTVLNKKFNKKTRKNKLVVSLEQLT